MSVTTEIPPYQRHSETSRSAALSKVVDTPSEKGRVYRFLRGQGWYGATDEEVQEALTMGASTQRPRRIELVREGLAYRNLKTRPTSTGRAAAVWVACRCDELPDDCPGHTVRSVLA